MKRATTQEIIQDVPPLATRLKDVHLYIHDLTDADSPFVAVWFGQRNQWLDLSPSSFVRPWV